MSEPVSQTSPSSAPVVIRIILVILAAVPGIIGLFVLGFIAAAFTFEGFRFLDADKDYVVIFVILSAAFILFSAIVIGIILRYARWRKAPAASLVLSIIVVFANVIGTGMLETTITDGEEWQLLIVSAGFGIVAGALPPFLHWWNASRPTTA